MKPWLNSKIIAQKVLQCVLFLCPPSFIVAYGSNCFISFCVVFISNGISMNIVLLLKAYFHPAVHVLCDEVHFHIYSSCSSY